jgi:uncharacterized membrane protein YhaH (DUF805 family)
MEESSMESFKADFLDIITKNYANIYGRVRRRVFWMFTLWQTLVYIAIGVLAGISAAIESPVLLGIFVVAYILVFLALIVPNVCLTVRRLHDMGQSGWLLLLNLIGLGIVVLILCLIDSQPGENKYGPNPKGL